MPTVKITILGTSLEFASDLLLQELCGLEQVSIQWYDVNVHSEMGIKGKQLALQAIELHPGKKITHTTEISDLVNSDIIIVWGLYFPPSKPYMAAYKEFYSGLFKTEIERKFAEEGDTYSPTIIFLENNGSGQIAGNVLGIENPKLRKNIWVLAPINDAMNLNIYFRVDAPPIEVEKITPSSRPKVTSLLEVNGGMLDVDGIVTCVKGLLSDEQSPRDLFLYVGMFPTKEDQERWKIEGNVCLFLPKTDATDEDDKLQPILKKEAAAVKEFLSK